MAKVGKQIGKYIGLSEVAELLGASRATCRKWLADADVPAFVLGSGPTGTIRYLAADVQDYLDECEEELDGSEDEEEATDEEELDDGEEDEDSESDEDGEDDDESDQDPEDDDGE